MQLSRHTQVKICLLWRFSGCSMHLSITLYVPRAAFAAASAAILAGVPAAPPSGSVFDTGTIIAASVAGAAALCSDKRRGATSTTFPPAPASTRPRSSRRRAATAAASPTAGAAPTHPVLLPATLAPLPHVHWRASPFLAQSLTTPPTALTGPMALPHVQPQRSSQRAQPPGSGVASSSYVY